MQAEKARVPQAWSPHTVAVMALRVGQECVLPGVTAQKAHRYIYRARMGTSKWFEARTLTAGACIRRVE